MGAMVLVALLTGTLASPAMERRGEERERIGAVGEEVALPGMAARVEAPVRMAAVGPFVVAERRGAERIDVAVAIVRVELGEREAGADARTWIAARAPPRA